LIPVASTDLEELSAAEIDEIVAIYADVASRRRQSIPLDEARAIVATIELSPAWERSQVRHVGAVRTATRHLLASGWHWTQIARALVEVCHEQISDLGVCEMAVAGGIADWRRSR
jgi:hypothetical protein